MTFAQTIGTIVVGAAVLIGSYFGIHSFVNNLPPVAGSFNPTGGGTYLLQSSISASQSTITLTSFTEPGSNTPYTMSYINTDILYGTINPNSNGGSEFISATGITQNANGTATLTGVIRGESRTPGTGGCVASSTLAHPFPGQTQFILSNSPCFYSEFAERRSDQNIYGAWTYSSTSPPRYDSTAAQHGGNYIATTSEFASVDYVNHVALVSAPNAAPGTKGVVDIATALQQASTSATGVSSSIRVLAATNSTDTPQTGCAAGYTATAGAGCTVIAQLTGKIRQTFINLNEAWTFAANLTSSAITTIAASDLSTHALFLNTLAYSFPSTRAASSTVLTENGSGTLKFQIPTVITLGSGVNQTTTNSATTSLATIKIAAAQFATNTNIQVHSHWTHAGGNQCFVQFDIGTGAATSTNGSLGFYNLSRQDQIDGIYTASSTTAVMGSSFDITSGFTSTPTAPSATLGNSSITGISTAAIMYLSIAARSVSSDTCTLEDYQVELHTY